MKQTQLKCKEVNQLLEKYSISLSKKDQVVLVETEIKLILVNRQPSFFYYHQQLVPTLKYLQHNIFLKKVTVDQGAIKFIIGGADVMRPGITEIESGITKDEIIVIMDQNNKKLLAVGIALFNSEQIKAASSGKVVKNIHYVGDKIWMFR
ncbi:MAG TPA: DUF1947 domain-containing protein [Candidatus Nanoarchaeia archaeon]|nr:DUF1947 domain-containing protein [Candidatus Nanoarchaeia archaeon]